MVTVLNMSILQSYLQNFNIIHKLTTAKNEIKHHKVTQLLKKKNVKFQITMGHKFWLIHLVLDSYLSAWLNVVE